MLILTRYPGESIIIDKKTTLMVLDTPGGGRVRLGFEAPNDVHIVREEIENGYTEEIRLSKSIKNEEK